MRVLSSCEIGFQLSLQTNYNGADMNSAEIVCDAEISFRLRDGRRTTETETRRKSVNLSGGYGSERLLIEIEAPQSSLNRATEASLETAKCRISSVYPY